MSYSMSDSCLQSLSKPMEEIGPRTHQSPRIDAYLLGWVTCFAINCCKSPSTNAPIPGTAIRLKSTGRIFEMRSTARRESIFSEPSLLYA